MSPRRLPILTLLSLAAFPAAADAVPAGTTRIVSGDDALVSALPAPVSESWLHAGSVSQTGRYVAFQSRADGLSAEDDDGVTNVFVKDRQTGAVVLASREDGEGGVPAHVDCFDASISDDGMRVAFTCAGALDPADGNDTGDVYVRDLVAGTTRLVSRASGQGGVVGSGSSRAAMISGNGGYVVFESGATNLAAADPNERPDIYRRQLAGAQETVLVSRDTGPGGAVGNSGSRAPAVSDDGDAVVFLTDAGNLGADDDTNGRRDAYLREVSAGTTALMSGPELSGSATGNGDVYSAAISGQKSGGQYYVAFATYADNLGPADGDGAVDVYRRAAENGAVVLVSRADDEAQIGVYAGLGEIDDSGTRISFATYAPLDAADTDELSAYVRTIGANTTELLARHGDGGPAMAIETGAASMSGDGLTFAFDTEEAGATADADPQFGNAYVRDLHGAPVLALLARPAGTAPFVNAGGPVEVSDSDVSRTMSDDGARLVVVAQRNGIARAQAWVRDLRGGGLILASRADGAQGAPAGASTEAAISADGTRVAFITRAALDPADTDERDSLYVRDLATGRTLLAGRADGATGAVAESAPYAPALDADGSRVAFATQAANLADGDADAGTDVHVRDLAAGRTLLASGGATGDAYAPSLDAAGRRVAFSTSAKDAAAGDADEIPDIHVRDLEQGTEQLVSAVPGGAKGDGPSVAPTISADGTVIAFSTRAPTLTNGAGGWHLAVRDLAAGSLVLADRLDGVTGALVPQGISGYALSGDGHVVAFLTPGAVAEPSGTPHPRPSAFVRDLRTGKTVLGSRANGADGKAAFGFAPALGADGSCLAFTTRDPLAPGAGTDHAQRYVRALTPACPPVVPDGAGGGGGQGGGEQTDRTAPVLGDVSLRGTRRKRVIRLTSSEAATLKVVVKRRKAGTKRYRRVGAFKRSIAAGAVKVRWDGRLRGKRLRSGRYRLVLRATDAAGNRSAAARLAFRVKPRR